MDNGYHKLSKNVLFLWLKLNFVKKRYDVTVIVTMIDKQRKSDDEVRTESQEIFDSKLLHLRYVQEANNVIT